MRHVALPIDLEGLEAIDIKYSNYICCSRILTYWIVDFVYYPAMIARR